MVKLRLRRRGRKRLPVYDIVASDSRSPRDGRYIEKIGQYNPLITSGATILDRDRATYWLRTGAQPTDTVRNILSREGILLSIEMERKGASQSEISSAVDAHISRYKSRETTKPKAQPVVEEAAPRAGTEEDQSETSEVAAETSENTEVEASSTEAAPETEASENTEAEVVSNEGSAGETGTEEGNEEASEEPKSAE